jgi:hypothetical protein
MLIFGIVIFMFVIRNLKARRVNTAHLSTIDTGPDQLIPQHLEVPQT